MQEINTIFYIVILIMSVIIHEISHGYAAKFLGDNTAEYAGRLTLNPLNRKWGTVVVASAGIISNLTLALLFGLLIRISISMDFASPAFLSISGLIVLVNIVLGIFNLIPIPPLDGSKILFSLLPAGWRRVQIILEQYSLVVLIIFIFFGWQYLSPVIFGLFKFLTG